MKIKRLLSLCLICLGMMPVLKAQSLAHRLEALPQAAEVKVLETTHFQEKYLVRFTQPVNPHQPEQGTFQQRVFVCHRGYDCPTVLVTEGYGAHYALNPHYRNELSELLGANILVVEHRYFLESVPDPCDWAHFNGHNEAHDLHAIVEAFKALYTGSWIATGASKGGHNTLIYTAHYPNDMDLAVPYVGPLCRSTEDGRHEPFLADSVGTLPQRQYIQQLQIEILKRKEALLAPFDSLCQANHYAFSLPIRSIYDYAVLEFPFAFWQMGYTMEALSALDASNRDLFNCFVQISDPGYFVHESTTTPFFIQAAKELGYYGYNLEPFRAYSDLTSTAGYLHDLFIPKGLDLSFDPSLYDYLMDFLQNGQAQMIFIYGEYDPWSAVRVPDFGRENIRIYIAPQASHGAKIASFDEATQTEIKDLIQRWLQD